MDFEDEMDLFFIRRDDLGRLPKTFDNENSSRPIYSKNVFNCAPLMVKHLKSLDESSQNVYKFSNSPEFKNCLVYGKIIGKGAEYKSSYNYKLDDGTAFVNINMFRRTSDMETIWKLDNELQAIKRQILVQNKIEIVNSLKNLIFKSKEQIDNSNIALGTKVLVYGKPNFHRGEVSLKAFHIIEDGKYNRDIEIYFKDYLMDWYKNMMVLTNS